MVSEWLIRLEQMFPEGYEPEVYEAVRRVALRLQACGAKLRSRQVIAAIAEGRLRELRVEQEGVK